MKRGEIWIAAGRGDYLGKPRPVVVVQSDQFELTDSITVCPVTTDSTEASLLRVALIPSLENGLREPCRIMIDKVPTLRKTRLVKRIGRLASEDTMQVDSAIASFLGVGTVTPIDDRSITSSSYR